jgi:hypothetical protein
MAEKKNLENFYDTEIIPSSSHGHGVSLQRVITLPSVFVLPGTRFPEAFSS